MRFKKQVLKGMDAESVLADDLVDINEEGWVVKAQSLGPNMEGARKLFNELLDCDFVSKSRIPLSLADGKPTLSVEGEDGIFEIEVVGKGGYKSTMACIEADMGFSFLLDPEEFPQEEGWPISWRSIRGIIRGVGTIDCDEKNKDIDWIPLEMAARYGRRNRWHPVYSECGDLLWHPLAPDGMPAREVRRLIESGRKRSRG